MLRWAFETTVREGLPPDEPEVLRALAGVGWRIEARLTPGRWAMAVDEVRRTFRVSVRTAESAAREAYDLGLQARMEELLLPRLAPEGLDDAVRVEGELPAGGVLLVYPHAGSLALALAALARRRPGLLVFRAGRVAPAHAASMGSMRPSAVNRHLAERAGEEEARLPVGWTDDVGAVAAALRAGRTVAAAFDDRAWPTYEVVHWFDRLALLSPDPWRLARACGATVVPASVRREHDKTHRVRLGPPVVPDLERYLAEVAGPWLRANPGHYAGWLAACRMRAGVDDHPLFIDSAPDVRWRRWAQEGERASV